MDDISQTKAELAQRELLSLEERIARIKDHAGSRVSFFNEDFAIVQSPKHNWCVVIDLKSPHLTAQKIDASPTEIAEKLSGTTGVVDFRRHIVENGIPFVF